MTVVSPVNYFLFTPMLPSATVGTLELRSLVEPVRKSVGRVRGHFLKAMAEDVEFGERLVEVSQVDSQGVKRHFYLPYDKLIIGVGMSVQFFMEQLRRECVWLMSAEGRLDDKPTRCQRAGKLQLSQID